MRISSREKEERKMEGEGERLPREEGGKKSMTKIIAAVVVIILVVAAIGGALLLLGGKEAANKSPTVSFSASNSVVNTSTPVIFNATASNDADGTIANYTWQYGDGVEEMKTSALTQHTYAYPGKYIVVLTVEDNEGAMTTSWSTAARIEVLNPVPETTDNDTIPFALVGTSGDIVQNNTLIDFDAMSSGAYSIVYDEDNEVWSLDFGIQHVKNVEWHFGDGSAIVSGNTTEAGVVNNTYEGNGDVYASYAVVTSVHDTVQRYYNTIVVLPVGQSSGGIVNPDVFTYAEFGEPEGLDPAWDYESSGGEIIQNVYETLVFYAGASSSELSPYLATEVPSVANGGIADNFTTWTYHIRANVKFHNGETLTGSDVVYSLKRVLIMNDAQGPAWMLGQYMCPSFSRGELVPMDEINASIELVDAMTVQIHLLMTMPAWNYIMAYTVAAVVSEDFVEAHGGVAPLERNAYMDRHMDGTGPFSLMEWAPNQHIIMVRNDNYWRDPAPFKYVIIKKVQDYGTRLMLIKSGQVDGAMIAVMHHSDVVNQAGITLHEMLPTLSVNMIIMHTNFVPSDLDVGDIPPTFFNDINVRKAFCYAFPYQKFIDKVTLGTAIQPNGPVVEGLLGYDPDVPMYNFNLTKAAEYLKLAEDARHPGTTYADNGFALTLYYNAGNDARQQAMLMLSDSFTAMSQNATLGITGKITCKVIAADWPSLLSYRTHRMVPILYMGWIADYPDPDDFANPIYHENGDFCYYSGIHNHTLSLMIEAAALELNNTIRAQMYHNISVAGYGDAMYIFPTQPTAFFVHRSWVQGFVYNMMFSNVYYYWMSKA
jgi:peptide/nickel transport system substrate-binding protein